MPGPISRLPRSLFLLLAAAAFLPSGGEAQILKKLKNVVKDAAESETAAQIDRLVRGKVRCVFDDLECIKDADESGKGAVLTDDGGGLLLDPDGKPVSDPDEGARIAERGDVVAKPGEGAWANYDFQPGDQILFADDFRGDAVGDFPRRFELVQGNWEIVEWQGGRYLRATSTGIIGIPLPATLPERFTIESSVNITHGNGYFRVMTGRAFTGPGRTYRGSSATAEYGVAGIRPVDAGPSVLSQLDGNLSKAIHAFRVMGDGNHLKVYLGERRVANAPNAVFPRSDTLFIAVGSAAEETPILVGPIRIAGGGRDLYDRLARDGRVATQGILFATGSARIRPESTPTLKEIGSMLEGHADLRISIEGHTDAEGDDASNQTLSERRAAAVKAYLVEQFGIDEARLETAGFGETKPAADNATPEGRQQNRRVELVRLGS